MQIDWESDRSAVLSNPAYSSEDKARFEQIINLTASSHPGHLWLATSGSTVQKWVGLSKTAVLASAAAVNVHLESSQNDRWVQTLPTFHVGGLGILARAYLSGAVVYDFKGVHPGKWQPEQFFSFLVEVKGTLTSLVPAQLHDLVQLQKHAPPSLRAVVIGGGQLQENLYRQAVALGWPVLPSYGMTECASQIATAPLNWTEDGYPPLKLLSHLEGNVREGRLCFRGGSLLSAYALVADGDITVSDPKEAGWLMTEDRGEIHEGVVTILGRASGLIKIGGENVDVDRLEANFQQIKDKFGIGFEATLVPVPDERLGFTIHLATVQSNNDSSLERLIQGFNATVLPFERIRGCRFVSHLPRSPLGKIIRSELLQQTSATLRLWNH
jgi:o-succinylbenzoate---CoA ligase